MNNPSEPRYPSRFQGLAAPSPDRPYARFRKIPL